MLKCPELSRLPKATGLKSVNFARQTPGTVNALLNPRAPNRIPNVIDPTHPANRKPIPRSAFPASKVNNALSVRAFPMAMLQRPEVEWTGPLKRTVESWESRVQRMHELDSASTSREVSGGFSEDGRESKLSLPPMKLNNDRAGRISMSFINVMNVNTIGKVKRCIRTKIIKKVKTAVNHVLVRGADVVEEPVNMSQREGKQKMTKKIIFSSSTPAKESQWVLQGWSYIFVPSLEVYLMPYHDLIPVIRKTLKEIWEQGTRLEAQWERSISLTPKSSNRRTSKDRMGRPERTHSVSGNDHDQERSRPILNIQPINPELRGMNWRDMPTDPVIANPRSRIPTSSHFPLPSIPTLSSESEVQTTHGEKPPLQTRGSVLSPDDVQVPSTEIPTEPQDQRAVTELLYSKKPLIKRPARKRSSEINSSPKATRS